jgi:hypothetical protein
VKVDQGFSKEQIMRKAFVFAAVVLGMGLMTGTVSAQDDEDVKTKFYDFDDMLIDGEFKKPEGFVYGSIEKAKFDRLLSLKKSFLPKIEQTAKSDVLKR